MMDEAATVMLRVARRTARRLGVALSAVALVFASPAAARDDDRLRHSADVESIVATYPQQAVAALEHISRRTEGTAAERRHAVGLQGQGLILTGRVAEARELTNQLDSEAQAGGDPLLAAVALLIRSDLQWQVGDSAAANALAQGAQVLLQTANDPFLAHWAALALGTTARARGQFQDAVAALHIALAHADQAENPSRRAAARYQLAVLMLALKQPRQSYDESVEAFRQAVAARNPYLMAKAKMAESAALEALERSEEELEALEAALTIARTTSSRTAEALALVNLSDIELRRKDFRSAHDLSRAALEIARQFNDIALVATAKANMGFALLAQGRIEAGKRLADEAVAEYERTSATAEIASLLAEYGHYLETAGDHRAALALFHRERKLNEEMTFAAHDKTVMEIAGRYEADRRKRELELQLRDKDLKSAELSNRRLKEQLWWLLAFVFAASFVIVAILYRKLQITNRLLAKKNRELTSQSTLDPLTTLYNRRYFQEFVRLDTSTRERECAHREPMQGLFLIDLDHFKTVNDRHGHAAGDAALIALARRLRRTLREKDMIVRWGGEEFLVFTPDVTPDQLNDIALRMMDAASAEPVMFRGHPIRITVSIGFAPMPLPPHDTSLPWERTLALVDMALYMAKLHGRNRAFGLKSLARDDAQLLEIVERDLESAWRAGLVDMEVLVNGPRPEVPGIVAASVARAAA